MRHFLVTNTYQFLTIPLQVGYMLKVHGKERLGIVGGMSYNFLAGAHTHMDIDYYYKGKIFQPRQELVYDPQIVLTSSDTRLNLEKESGMLFFNPTLHFGVYYPVSKHFAATFSYEYQINDINSNPVGKGYMKLQYVGLGLGLGYGL